MPFLHTDATLLRLPDSLRCSILPTMSLAVAILTLPWMVTGVVTASALVASVASRRCRNALNSAIFGE